LSTSSARTSHEQTRIHKTHHDLDLREAITFPLIVYYVPLHEAHIQMTCDPEITKIRTLVILGTHNFVYKPLIEMKLKLKL